MHVRMKTKIGGYRNEVPWPEVGDTIEVPDHEANDLIRNGYAEPVSYVADSTTPEGTDDAPAHEPEPSEDPADDEGQDPTDSADPDAGDDQDVTKADLIARAEELGVEVDGRWGKAKLLSAIAAAEAAASGED